MQVDLGMTVYASDGEKVGSVNKIVLDPESKTIGKFIVDGGAFSGSHKLVDINMVTGAVDDGLRIDIPKSEFNDLPDFVQERFVVAEQEQVTDYPFITPNAGGAGSFLFAAPGAAHGYGGRTDSLFAPVNPVAPVVETRSNLRDVDVVISEGTDVVGSDGEKVGTVGKVVFNDDGSLAGFIVSKGLIFKNDVRVPIDWVTETGNDRIVLNVPSAEAETRAYHVEDTTL